MSDSPTTLPVNPLWPRLRKLAGFLLLAILVVAGLWAGFRYAKLHLALGHARHEFATRQFMRAEFWAGRALSVDRKNVEATRLMAEINEAQDKPAALSWRIKVVQRAPGNVGDIMAWAKCAFRFGQREMAAVALKSLPPEFQNRSADYHALMAGCALAEQQGSAAEAHFVKAAELDHDNPVHRVNLASFRLTNSPSAEVRAAAARDLEDALTDPRARLFAARALLAASLRAGDRVGTARFVEKLRSFPEHSFGDDLSCLEAVLHEPEFPAALAALERRAVARPDWTTEIAEWLNSHGQAQEVVRWFTQLPAPFQTTVRVQIAAAEAYVAVADWPGLAAFLEKCQWDEGDYLRQAMLIRCHRELSQPWEKEWNQLVAEVGARPPDGYLLAQVAIGWGWGQQALALLWGAANRPETGSIALQKLWDIYSLTKDTRELLHVARAQSDRDPSSPATKNNEAFLSLLVHGPSERAERLAREASVSNPKLPEWAATYAYALHLAGQDSEAKKVMENLPSDALSHPGIALYSAIILAANGDDTRAREALEKLNPRGMLPEEQQLATELAQKLKAPNSHSAN